MGEEREKSKTDWRRDEVPGSHLGTSGDSDDPADSPSKGVSPRTPAAGDSDDQGDDKSSRSQKKDQPS